MTKYIYFNKDELYKAWEYENKLLKPLDKDLLNWIRTHNPNLIKDYYISTKSNTYDIRRMKKMLVDNPNLIRYYQYAMIYKYHNDIRIKIETEIIKRLKSKDFLYGD